MNRMKALTLLSVLVVASWNGPANAAQIEAPARKVPKYHGRTLPDWVRALEEAKDPAQKMAVLQTLIEIGPKARPAIPALLPLLKEENLLLRTAAAVALWVIDGQRGAALPILRAALESDDGLVRLRTIQWLAGIGPAAKELAPALQAQLKKGFITETAFTLWQVTGDASLAVPPLCDALKKEHFYGNKLAALHKLGQMGPGARSAVPQILPLLKDREISFTAAQVLDLIDPEEKPAARALVALLEDADDQVRVNSAATLGLWRLNPKVGIVALIPLLNDENARVRQAAAATLRRYGPDAEAAVPALQKMKKDARAELDEVSAAKALLLIEPSREDAGRILSTEETPVSEKLLLVQGLGELGPKAKNAVSTLAALLADRDGRMRIAAAEALGKIGPAAKEALESLEDAAASKGIYLQMSARWAIWRIDGREKPLVEVLHKMLKPKASFNSTTFDYLMQLGPKAMPAVPELIALLDDPSETLRRTAAKTLGAIGPDAKSAIPALEFLANEELDPYLRRAASEALTKIGAGR